VMGRCSVAIQYLDRPCIASMRQATRARESTVGKPANSVLAGSAPGKVRDSSRVRSSTPCAVQPLRGSRPPSCAMRRLPRGRTVLRSYPPRPVSRCWTNGSMPSGPDATSFR
jgi:hypothetical protein